MLKYILYIIMILAWIYYVPKYICEQTVTTHTYTVIDKIVETSAFGSIYSVVIQDNNGEIILKNGIDDYYQYPPKGSKWHGETYEGTFLSFLSGIYSVIVILFSIYIFTDIIDKTRYRR